MATELKVAGFNRGIQNKLPAEDIEQSAGSDALNWISQDGKLELIKGRRVVGETGSAGGIFAEIWAPRVDGTKLHFVKRNTDIGYYDDDEVYHSVITGLTAGSTYTFSVYSSLAGNYLFATGPDGLFKLAIANPDNYKDMYEPLTGATNLGEYPNYLGYSLINDRRLIMWNRFDDLENKTALFLSKIDPQDGTNYTFVGSQVLATGDGGDQYSGTLEGSAGLNFSFGLDIYGDEEDITENITGVVDGANLTGFLLSDTNGFEVGSYLHVEGIDGTGDLEELNGNIYKIIAVDTNFSVIVIASSNGTWNSGGVLRPLRKGPYEDDNNGGFQNAEGTINYATGDVSITLPYNQAAGAPLYAVYQYENSNNGGITDFRSDDSTDLTQGIAIQQEYNGSPIMTVIPFEGSYFSMKSDSVYQLTPASDWSSYTNQIYRTDIGVPSLRSATGTGQGIVYIDTANPSKPILSILQRSTVGGNLSPINLTPLFAWENYEFDQALVDTFDQNIVVSCRTPESDTNNRLILVDVPQQYTPDITYYGANTSAKNGQFLYLGSPTTDTVWEAFSGTDDIEMALYNFWEGKAETYGDDTLKKTRYLQIKGHIDPLQSFEVYGSFDGGDWTLLGTVRGDKSYVDTSSPAFLGGTELGEDDIGGGTATTIYPYLAQLKIRTPKFRTRTLRFVATGIGYVCIEWHKDFDILAFEQRLPSRYRTKQYVSLDGQVNNLPTMDTELLTVSTGDADDDYLIL